MYKLMLKTITRNGKMLEKQGIMFCKSKESLEKYALKMNIKVFKEYFDRNKISEWYETEEEYLEAIESAVKRGEILIEVPYFYCLEATDEEYKEYLEFLGVE